MADASTTVKQTTPTEHVVHNEPYHDEENETGTEPAPLIPDSPRHEEQRSVKAVRILTKLSLVSSVCLIVLTIATLVLCEIIEPCE